MEGSGPPIALLHGWALDLHYWDPLIALLAARFTLLRFDRRGFGLSRGTPDVQKNVGDLVALLDAAGMHRPVVLGMSQGARLAIHFALEHPDRTRALVLDGAPALEAESELPSGRYRGLLETQGARAMQADILLHPLMQLSTTEPAAHALLSSVVARYSGQDLMSAARRRAAPDLRAIAVPALILNGDRDSAERRAAGRNLQATIHGARHEELPGGHLALLDDPEAYAQAVAGFCAALAP